MRESGKQIVYEAPRDINSRLKGEASKETQLSIQVRRGVCGAVLTVD